MKRIGILAVWLAGAAWGQAPVEKPGGTINLPSSKQIHGVAPGGPQQLSSLPVALAVSPATATDPAGRYVVTVNGGYGSLESKYEQSLAVLDTKTGVVTDFNDSRTGQSSKQVLFSGLAFSADGMTLYGTIVSESDPTGQTGRDTGTGIQVYGFADGKITRDRVIKIAPQPLAPGRTTLLVGGGAAGSSFGDGSGGRDHTKGMPYPAAIAVVGNGAGMSRAASSQVSEARPGAPSSEGGVGNGAGMSRAASSQVSAARPGAPTSEGGVGNGAGMSRAASSQVSAARPGAPSSEGGAGNGTGMSRAASSQVSAARPGAPSSEGRDGNGAGMSRAASSQVSAARPGAPSSEGGVGNGAGMSRAASSQVSAARPGAPSSEGRDELLVAGNLSDDVWLMDAATGAVTTRFDLSENVVVPSTYPIALAVSKDSTRGYVALWNASEVVELDLVKGTVGRKLPLLKNDDPVRPGSHPDALAMSPDGKTLYVALGNRDAVAAVDLDGGGFKLKGYYDTRLPGQSFFGAEPEALALNADGSRLYVANLGTDSVAVINTKSLTKNVARKGMAEPIGFIPTEWLPTGVVFSGGKLYIATGKGTGTGPNNFPQTLAEGMPKPKANLAWAYIPTLLHGSIAAVDAAMAEKNLHELTAETLTDERLRAAKETIQWDPGVMAKLKTSGGSTQVSEARPGAPGGPTQVSEARPGAPGGPTQVSEARPGAPGGPTQVSEARPGAPKPGPIRHVIYIIRENRTYDQLFGDLGVGNGDKSLTMYGREITPNAHKLALQFGVLDNFYDSAEVSGDGHVWSNTAIGTDYLERTWQLNYRGAQRGYDFEGVVSSGLPLEQKIPDVNEPNSGYIWGNLTKHGMTLYHFGEFISSRFCTEKAGGGAQTDSQQGPMLEGAVCSRNDVKPGEKLPEVWGGGVNKWPWAIPLIASNKATKPELVGHFAPEAPDFNLKIPDQIREDIFEKHFAGWLADQQAGKDTMPNFVMLRLANDHTNGTTAGGPSPKSSVADNDLAVGRVVETISNSPFWDDTAIFVLEDDAQNGADHVDAHRSIALVISKYAPHALGVCCVCG